MSLSIWQQVEFGSYDADIPVWCELADQIGDPVVELGAGAGRIALELAERGHQVLAIERDPDLAAELERNAQAQELAISVIGLDLEAPAEPLPSAALLGVGPLHVIQMIAPEARHPLFAWLHEVITPGGTLALTLVDENTLISAGTSSPQILPDMRQVDGWVYSSEPLWVQVSDHELRVRRIRESVSPEGRMERSVHDDVLQRIGPEQLEEEAAGAGWRPAGRRQIVYGPDDADSVVVLLERAA